MAFFNMNLRTISRGNFDTTAKKVSYIMRDKVYDPIEKTYHYNRKADILHSEIILPENAPTKFHDLQTLVDEVERAEKRYDARIGREVRMSLPNNTAFTLGDLIRMAKEYVAKAFIELGMCAVMGIHEGKNLDPSKNNPHVHVFLTDRPIDSNGFCTKKDRSWNKRSNIRKWRKMWAEVQNRFFQEKGLADRVDHESLEVQGIDREPTRPLGREAVAMERKGTKTERGNRNKEIEARNRQREEHYRNRHYDRSQKRDRGRERSR